MQGSFTRRWHPAQLCAAAIVGIVISSCSLPLPISVEHVAYNQQYANGLDYSLPTGIVDLTIKATKPSGGANANAPTKKNPANNSNAQSNNKPHNNASGSSNNKPAPGAITAQLPTVTLSINKVQYVPDPRFQYSVNINHDALFDDDISVSVDTNDLLKSVNSTTTDQTPQIIEKIAEAPVQVLTAGRAPALISKTKKQFDIEYSLDPTSQQQVRTLNNLLGTLSPRIQFTANPVISPSQHRKRLPRCSINICFRTAMPYTLELRTLGQSSVVLARTIVVLPNKNAVAQIPVTRAPFVKKTVQLQFTNGMLTSVNVSNPSEVKAFVEIPITVAKSIVSIPSAMFQFKTTQITADNNLLSAQKQNLALQQQIIQTQQQLVAAQAAARNQ